MDWVGLPVHTRVQRLHCDSFYCGKTFHLWKSTFTMSYIMIHFICGCQFPAWEFVRSHFFVDLHIVQVKPGARGPRLRLLEAMAGAVRGRESRQVPLWWSQSAEKVQRRQCKWKHVKSPWTWAGHFLSSWDVFRKWREKCGDMICRSPRSIGCKNRFASQKEPRRPCRPWFQGAMELMAPYL